MTPSDTMSNPDYLSGCIVKCLCRGQLDQAKFYLDKLIKLQSVPGARNTYP